MKQILIPRLSLEVSFLTEETRLFLSKLLHQLFSSACGRLNNIADWLISELNVALQYPRVHKKHQDTVNSLPSPQGSNTAKTTT